MIQNNDKCEYCWYNDDPTACVDCPVAQAEFASFIKGVEQEQANMGFVVPPDGDERGLPESVTAEHEQCMVCGEYRCAKHYPYTPIEDFEF